MCSVVLSTTQLPACHHHQLTLLGTIHQGFGSQLHARQKGKALRRLSNTRSGSVVGSGSVVVKMVHCISPCDEIRNLYELKADNKRLNQASN